LADFEREHDILQKELSGIEADIEYLERMGADQPLIRSTLEDTLDEVHLSDQYDLQDDDPLLLIDRDWNERFRLSEYWRSDVPARNEFDLIAATEAIDRTRFVNVWLLWNLRASRQQIMHFKNHVQGLVNLSPEAISREALRLWLTDGAACCAVTGVESPSHSALDVVDRDDPPQRPSSLPQEREKSELLRSRSR
jgi:hypothetical protein